MTMMMPNNIPYKLIENSKPLNKTDVLELLKTHYKIASPKKTAVKMSPLELWIRKHKKLLLHIQREQNHQKQQQDSVQYAKMNPDILDNLVEHNLGYLLRSYIADNHKNSDPKNL
jgi:hypothetical protein